MPAVLKIDTFWLVVPAGVMTGTRCERYHGSGRAFLRASVSITPKRAAPK
jgi:hypothetical protein